MLESRAASGRALSGRSKTHQDKNRPLARSSKAHKVKGEPSAGCQDARKQNEDGGRQQNA